MIAAGDTAFTEPESAALHDFVAAADVRLVLFYHSRGGWVEDGACADGNEQTRVLRQTLAGVLGFDYFGVNATELYPVTGNAPGYFNQIGVRALAIELTRRKQLEWTHQRVGMEAALAWAAANLKLEVE